MSTPYRVSAKDLIQGMLWSLSELQKMETEDLLNGAPAMETLRRAEEMLSDLVDETAEEMEA